MATYLALTETVNRDTLNILAYTRNLALAESQQMESVFAPMAQQPGVHEIDAAVNLFLHGKPDVELEIQPGTLKAALEAAPSPGQKHFSFFRPACRSDSPAEEFMHLYNVLLMLFGDEQTDVDAFIVAQEPTVVQTPRPPKKNAKNPKPGRPETNYTRLRNELGHQRANVDVEATKQEMANQLAGLRELVRKAIEPHP